LAAILLALAASVSWGASDFLGGLANRRLSLATVMGVATPVGLVVLGVVLAVRGQAPPNTVFALWAGITGFLGVIGIASLYHGLAVGRMGVVAPISATAPLIPVAVGLARGERPSSVQGVGMALALAGIVLSGREHDSSVGRRVASGAGFAAIAAVCFGCSLLSLDEAASDDPYWAAFGIRVTGMVVVAVVLLVTRSPVRVSRPLVPALIGIGVLDVTGTICFGVSTTKGLISVVAVIASLFPVFVAFLARVTLHERLEPVQLAGAASAIGGVALISVG
jgi:drug/metabolite transporter (DMT)-like permease